MPKKWKGVMACDVLPVAMFNVQSLYIIRVYVLCNSVILIKVSCDKSYLWIKVKIVKEVKRSDDLWRFACGDV